MKTELSYEYKTLLIKLIIVTAVTVCFLWAFNLRSENPYEARCISVCEQFNGTFFDYSYAKGLNKKYTIVTCECWDNLTREKYDEFYLTQ